MNRRRRIASCVTLALICVCALSVSTASTTTYTYDVHGRLTGVTRDGVVLLTRLYDPSNNPVSTAPLAASVSSTNWQWYRVGSGTPTVSPPVVVTASGGTPGYTYAWQRVSGDTQTTATAPTSHTTNWTRPTVPFNTAFNSVWRCLVTDSVSGTTYTVNVNVSFYREWDGCPTCLSWTIGAPSSSAGLAAWNL